MLLAYHYLSTLGLVTVVFVSMARQAYSVQTINHGKAGLKVTVSAILGTISFTNAAFHTTKSCAIATKCMADANSKTYNKNESKITF